MFLLLVTLLIKVLKCVQSVMLFEQRVQKSFQLYSMPVLKLGGLIFLVSVLLVKLFFPTKCTSETEKKSVALRSKKQNNIVLHFLKIGRVYLWTPVTVPSRIPSSASKF